MSEILLQSVSPFGSAQVVVEAQDGVVYLYLQGAEQTGFGMRSCWVANLRPGPADWDHARMQAGLPPQMPASHDRGPREAPPRPEDLSVVWMQTGDGVALFERGELLAVIPSWSGMEGFSGYARDCIGQTPVAFAMPEEPGDLIPRLEASDRFWDRWTRTEVFGPYRDDLLAAAGSFGTQSKYWATDGGRWPPRAVARFDGDDQTTLLTVGMGLLIQPRIELFQGQGTPGRRVELGISVAAGLGDEPILRLASWLASQSHLPWERLTWLGHGHTLPCDQLPSHQGAAPLPAVAFQARPPGLPDHARVHVDDEEVELTWAIPIGSRELATAREHGTETALAARGRVTWTYDWRVRA